MDDVDTHFCPMNQRRRVLHMATHAELVLYGDNRISSLGSEETRIVKQEIRIEPLRQLFAFCLRLDATALPKSTASSSDPPVAVPIAASPLSIPAPSVPSHPGFVPRAPLSRFRCPRSFRFPSQTAGSPGRSPGIPRFSGSGTAGSCIWQSNLGAIERPARDFSSAPRAPGCDASTAQTHSVLPPGADRSAPPLAEPSQAPP